jgi:hypothetical protein
MDVQALLATLMAEREKLTRAIVALEALRSPTIPIAPTIVKPYHGRGNSRPSKYPDKTKAVIVAKMQAVDKADGNLTATARELGKKYTIPKLTIASQWRKWAKRVNGQTAPFTSAETAAASDVSS